MNWFLRVTGLDRVMAEQALYEAARAAEGERNERMQKDNRNYQEMTSSFEYKLGGAKATIMVELKDQAKRQKMYEKAAAAQIEGLHNALAELESRLPKKPARRRVTKESR